MVVDIVRELNEMHANVIRLEKSCKARGIEGTGVEQLKKLGLETLKTKFWLLDAIAVSNRQRSILQGIRRDKKNTKRTIKYWQKRAAAPAVGGTSPAVGGAFPAANADGDAAQ